MGTIRQSIVRGVRRVFVGKPASSYFYMAENPHYAKHQIGRGTYGHPLVLFPEYGTLTIGAFCSIADGAIIQLGGNHAMVCATTYPFNHLWPSAAGIGMPLPPAGLKRDIAVGNDVWIARGAHVLSGVTIGNGAVVGAGSLVTKDVAPYEVVGGNPARHIRFRFSPDVVDGLQQLAWWRWPDERIAEALPLLLSGDVGALLSACREKATAGAVESPSE